MNRAKSDAGSTHVLEATIVASIMVSAVAFVVTWDQPQPAAFTLRDTLDTKAQDALDILYDTPVKSKFGKDALSAYIGECLNRRCGNLSTTLTDVLPQGSSYAFYLSNGYQTYPVLVNGTPSGEAVSAARTFEPDWSSTFLATATESVSPEDALLVYALPIYRSMPLTPGGSQLLVKVSGTRADGSDYVLVASAATVAAAADDLDVPAASLTFVHPSTGAVLPVFDMSNEALSTAQRFVLRLEETQGAWIPEDVQVTVHLPRGWSAEAPQAANDKWTIVSNADDPNGAYLGSSIVATLDDPLRWGVADLVFDASYHGDVLDFYPITASLSRGITANAAVLVRGDDHTTEPALATPLLHMSVPGPMGRSAETTWTLSAHIPVNESGLPGGLSAIVHVERVEIFEQDGNAIFGPTVSASLDERMGGEWVSYGDHLRWTGNVEMHVNSALNLTFRVSASGTPGPKDARSGFLPPVEFDDWVGRLVGRTGWGFYRQAILPASDDYEGYDPTAEPLGLMHPLETNGVYQRAKLPGKIQYNVSLVGAVEDSLYGSYVSAEDRSVPLGGEVVIDANVQSLLFALAEAGQRAGVTLRFYPPWSGDERTPIYEQENLDQGLLSGEVSHIVTIDLNGDGYVDPIIGTTNGRVIAYHGLTGQRLQGNTFTAPITEDAQQRQALPKITALEHVVIRGKDYFVVGTDVNSGGLYVLNTSFKIRWSYAFDIAGDTLAVDAGTDFNEDDEPDIMVARSFHDGTSQNALTYVLSAPAAASEKDLDPIPGLPPPIQDAKAFHYSLGTPTTLLAQRSVGPFGTGPGAMIPTQTMVDPGLTYTLSPPGVTRGAASSPRSGVQGIDEDGRATSTLFGAPASVLRDYDHDGDHVRDVLLGGSSGYVMMVNGTVLTQPLYSYILAGAPSIVSADSPSSVESYVLTSDGRVLMTDDAWVSNYATTGIATGGKAIASDEFNSYWVVGANNAVWRSTLVPGPDTPSTLRHPARNTLTPIVLATDPAFAGYQWATNLHEFRTIDFDGERGYIAGTACASIVLCSEPILLETTDGGDDWTRLSHAAGTLLDRNGDAVDRALNRVKIDAEGTAWIVGDGGLVLRRPDGGPGFREPAATWTTADDPPSVIPAPTYDFLDIACKPGALDECLLVGEGGAAFRSTDARSATPTWVNITGRSGLPTGRAFYSVGYPDDTRGYIGSKNMVLASFRGGNWTALPMNYLENDAHVVSTAGDGTGFVYGGSAANARIWLLHDYHIQSQVYTKSFADEFEEGSLVYRVELVDGNVSFAQQTIEVEMTEGTRDWTPFPDPLGPSTATTDQRKPKGQITSWLDANYLTLASDLRFRIALNTSGDKTILSPHVRSLTFKVEYFKPDENANPPYSPAEKTITLDFTTLDQVDLDDSSADWNTSVAALRQRLVNESWTRNVTGEVHDIQTGYDVVGDAHQDVWVATGDVLAENSPDHIIYAGTDPNTFIEKHNRVYLLDGLNGHPAAISEPLDGEVRHLRLADTDATPGPDILWAATWDSSGEATAHGRLYALDPITLDVQWSVDLEREVPADMELARLSGGDDGVFVGGRRPIDETSHTPHIWAISEALRKELWKVIPDDLGKYHITVPIEHSWLYGPHVVEIEVEWEEGVDANAALNCELCPPPEIPENPETPEPQTVLRSARFYDHFMVLPPDAVSSPHPLYTARLLVWMRDWG